MALFGWGKPKCSAGYREKAWVETRLRWLGEQLGMERLTRCEMILPTQDFFPDPYDATPEAAVRLLDRVCGYMQLPPGKVSLKVFSKEELAGIDATREPNEIWLLDTQLDDPMALAATLAAQAAYYLLMQRELLQGDRGWKWTMELATVYFGLGIFLANTTISDTHSHWGGNVKKQGYLPVRAMAYALALHAWLRGDTRPAWVGHLRPDAATAFNEGLQYLERTEDSLLRPDNLRRSDATSVERLLDQLQDGSPSARVAALWELAQARIAAEQTISAVVHSLSDPRPGIRAEAARTLTEFGSSADSAIHALIDAMDDSEAEVRGAAAFALGKLHLQPQIAVESLADHLDDSAMLDTVAWSLAQFAADARPALPRLLKRLQGELGRYSDVTDFLVYAVRAISPDPEAEIRQLIESCDPDLQQQAEHLLPEITSALAPRGAAGWWPWADGAS